MTHDLKVSAGNSTAQDGTAAVNFGSNFSQSALNSLEQQWTPIQIEKGHGAGAATPGFRAPLVVGDTGGFGGESVSPTVHELDPYFPFDAGISSDATFGWTNGGEAMDVNDFRIVACEPSNFPEADLNLEKMEQNKPGARKALNTVRTMAALRGPLILCGWGFGMDDFPVPNQGPANPERGMFKEGFLGNRADWKTGPVDLMWDDERQVWAGGHRIVCGIALGAISKGDICNPPSFQVELMRNTEGQTQLSNARHEKITVYNRDPSLEQDAVKDGIFVIATKINYEWLPLWVGCPEADEETGAAACIE